MSRHFLVLVATAVVLGAAALSQPGPGTLAAPRSQQPGPPVFSARAELVVLHVMVKDRKGSYVPSLPVEAFKVLEDGRPQAIQFFATQDAPATVGLLIDSSGSMFAARDRVVAAAAAFVETSNPQDEVFALAFNERVRAALTPQAPFTNDAPTMRAGLTGAISAWGRTALHDAILAGLEYAEKGSHPQKVLVVVSDGGDNASTATFDDILHSTQISNVAIYTIVVVDPLQRDAKPNRLRQLAEWTGGEAFRPRGVSEVVSALARIARDIRNTYTIGFMPPDTRRDGRTHRVRVVVDAPGHRALSVRTRQGYALDEK